MWNLSAIGISSNKLSIEIKSCICKTDFSGLKLTQNGANRDEFVVFAILACATDQWSYDKSNSNRVKRICICMLYIYLHFVCLAVCLGEYFHLNSLTIERIMCFTIQMKQFQKQRVFSFERFSLSTSFLHILFIRKVK